MLINYIYSIFAFLFGLCIGSFLNCVIYRLEEGKGINGRSFCPNCKHVLSWKDLFPVFSYLVLGGKCRYCKAKISPQYPILETITGLVFVLIFNQVQVSNFIGFTFLFYIASSLIIIFVYDLKHYLIPDKVLFPAIIIAFVYNLIFNFNLMPSLLLAVVIASGFFLTIFLISGGKWMGFGDVKLAILMGLLLGVPNILAALFLAFFFGAIIGVILMIFQKKSLRSEIPFGPFLIVGTFVAMFFGNQIIQWYLNFFQI